VWLWSHVAHSRTLGGAVEKLDRLIPSRLMRYCLSSPAMRKPIADSGFESSMLRGASRKVVYAALSSARCTMAQGPKALFDASLPRTGIVAMQHHPDHTSHRTRRWKERVKGFAAMPALALPRILATLVNHCCNRAALCMLTRYSGLLPQVSPRAQCGVQGCAGKAAVAPWRQCAQCYRGAVLHCPSVNDTELIQRGKG